ncbi:MAG: heat shock protein HspQ [Brevundimonas sp.]
MTQARSAKFSLGQIVRQRDQAFIGVVLDVDPAYDGPLDVLGPLQRNQPFYRILAAGPDGGFIAYAAEDALEPQPGAGVLAPDDEARWFTVDAEGRHAPRDQVLH